MTISISGHDKYSIIHFKKVRHEKMKGTGEEA